MVADTTQGLTSDLTGVECEYRLSCKAFNPISLLSHTAVASERHVHIECYIGMMLIKRFRNHRLSTVGGNGYAQLVGTQLFTDLSLRDALVCAPCRIGSLVAAWVEPSQADCGEHVISGVRSGMMLYCLACFCHQDAEKRL